MVRTNRLSKQIFKIDGNNCFMEVLNDRFFEGKVHFNFSAYDKEREAGDKIKEKIDFFLEFGDALSFCEMVINKTFDEKLKKERSNYQKALLKAESEGKALNQCGFIYNKSYWALTRGTDANKLPQKREDGKSESRRLLLMPGYVPPERMAHPEKFKNARKPNRFVLQCESGPGDKVNSSTAGGYIIKPAYGNKPEKKIMIPFPEIEDMNFDDKFLEMAQIIKSHVTGYIEASYSYEFMNPAPGIISAMPVHEEIKVGNNVDIVIYTPSNVTKIVTYIRDKEVLSDIPMEPKYLETNTIEWHFIKKATRASTTYFEFLPYAGFEKGEFTKKCRVIVKEK